MVTKKRILVMLVIVTASIGSVSAAVPYRGGFARFQAETLRPVMQWQDAQECPICDAGLDAEAVQRFQEARLEARQQAFASVQNQRSRVAGRPAVQQSRGMQNQRYVAPVKGRSVTTMTPARRGR